MLGVAIIQHFSLENSAQNHYSQIRPIQNCYSQVLETEHELNWLSTVPKTVV